MSKIKHQEKIKKKKQEKGISKEAIVPVEASEKFWFLKDDVWCCPCSNCLIYGDSRSEYVISDCYFNTEAKNKNLICSPFDMSRCVDASKFTTSNAPTSATPSKNHYTPNSTVPTTKHNVSEQPIQRPLDVIVISSACISLLMILFFACCCFANRNRYNPKKWLEVCLLRKPSNKKVSNTLAPTDLSPTDSNDSSKVISDSEKSLSMKESEDKTDRKIIEMVQSHTEECNEKGLTGGREDGSPSLPPKYWSSVHHPQPSPSLASTQQPNSFLNPTSFNPGNMPSSYSPFSAHCSVPGYLGHYPFSASPNPGVGFSPMGVPPLLSGQASQPHCSNNVILNNVSVHGPLTISHGHANDESVLQKPQDPPSASVQPSTFASSQLQDDKLPLKSNKDDQVESRPVRISKNDYEEALRRQGSTMHSSSDKSRPATSGSRSTSILRRHILASRSCDSTLRSSSDTKEPLSLSDTPIKNYADTARFEGSEHSPSFLRSRKQIEIYKELDKPIQETVHSPLLEPDCDFEANVNIYEPSKGSNDCLS